MANEQDPTMIIDETEFEITTAPSDGGSLADEIVEALFDDSAVETEVTYADTDGDGKIDAGAADTDGDGELDTIAGDTDGDGRVDAVSADTDGDGNLDAIAMDTDGDGAFDAAGADTDGDGQIDVAMLDTDGDGELDVAYTDADGDGEFEETAIADEGLPTEEELSTDSIEFTVGEDGFPITNEEYSTEVTDGGTSYEVADTGYSVADVPATGLNDPAPESTEDVESAAQQAHADAASEAQAKVDEYVAQGDYAAAVDAREIAENEAWAAGDSSMLGASDSTDLENAAYKQEIAEEYRVQQAEHIADGDYEAAKEDALNAGYTIGDADYLASGEDRTGQADQDAYNLGNAVHDEKNAEYFVDNAEWYAEQGNTDAAQSSLDNAAGYQESADIYAATADPASTMYDTVTPAPVGDAGYDMSAVDTGFDSSVDMSTPTTYDSGSDDGTV